jgi:hypothetical protein
LSARNRPSTKMMSREFVKIFDVVEATLPVRIE